MCLLECMCMLVHVHVRKKGSINVIYWIILFKSRSLVSKKNEIRIYERKVRLCAHEIEKYGYSQLGVFSKAPTVIVTVNVLVSVHVLVRVHVHVSICMCKMHTSRRRGCKQLPILIYLQCVT